MNTFVSNATTYLSTLDVITGLIEPVVDPDTCTDSFGLFVRGRMGDSDHEPFWNAGIPAIMVNDSANFRNANYHEPTDESATLDFPFMTQDVQAVVATAAEISGPFTYRPQYEIGEATAMLNAAFYAGEASDGSDNAGRMAFQGFTNADVSQAAFWATNLSTLQSAIFLVDVGDSSSWTRLTSDIGSLPDRPIYWLPDGSGIISRGLITSVPSGDTTVFNRHGYSTTSEGSITRLSSDNWYVDVSFSLGTTNLVAIPILSDGSDDLARESVYVTNFSAGTYDMDWPSITPDGTSVSWSNRIDTGPYDIADVYAIPDLTAILNAPLIGGTNISTLAPTTLQDSTIIPIRINDQFANTPFYSEDKSLVFFTEDWNRVFRVNNFFNTLFQADFDAMMRDADGVNLTFRIAEPGNQGTVIPTAGGTRLTYISNSGPSLLNLYMTSLTVVNRVLGTTVGNEVDNDIITTEEHVAEDASGTTVTIDASTTIDYPVGEEQVISIVTPIDPATEAQIPEDVDGIAAIRTFGPSGTTFDPAITITITFTDAEVAGMDESLLGVYLYNESTGIYDIQVPAEDIVSRDLVNNTITFTTDHFSTYALGVATEDTVAPVITLNGAASITIECGGSYTEFGASATDDRDGTVAVAIDNSSIDTSTLGAYTVTYTVTYTAEDAQGNTTVKSREVKVGDTTAPQATVTVTPDTLWPPNHKLIAVTPTVTATDACDTDPAIELISIVSSEGSSENTFDELFDDSVDDRNKKADVQIDDSGQILLRAERAGKSNRRTYTLNYLIIDASGNTTTASTTVTVPHNQ